MDESEALKIMLVQAVLTRGFMEWPDGHDDDGNVVTGDRVRVVVERILEQMVASNLNTPRDEIAIAVLGYSVTMGDVRDWYQKAVIGPRERQELPPHIAWQVERNVREKALRETARTHTQKRTIDQDAGTCVGLLAAAVVFGLFWCVLGVWLTSLSEQPSAPARPARPTVAGTWSPNEGFDP